jgi:hypothetical protein
MKRHNWERVFMLIAVILFWIAVMASFSSCGRKAWQNRGEKRGWIETKTDTIVTETVEKDTIFDWRTVKDTVVLRQDKLTVKYFHTDSTVYLSGKCDPDTIRIEKQIINTVKENGFYEMNFWGWALLAFVLLIVWRKFKS